MCEQARASAGQTRHDRADGGVGAQSHQRLGEAGIVAAAGLEPDVGEVGQARRVAFILLNSYDPGTGLLTRPAFEKRAQAMLGQDAHVGNHCVIYADIDLDGSYDPALALSVYADVFGDMMWIGLAAGAVMFLLTPVLKRLMR